MSQKEDYIVYYIEYKKYSEELEKKIKLFAKKNQIIIMKRGSENPTFILFSTTKNGREVLKNEEEKIKEELFFKKENITFKKQYQLNDKNVFSSKGKIKIISSKNDWEIHSEKMFKLALIINDMGILEKDVELYKNGKEFVFSSLSETSLKDKELFKRLNYAFLTILTDSAKSSFEYTLKYEEDSAQFKNIISNTTESGWTKNITEKDNLNTIKKTIKKELIYLEDIPNKIELLMMRYGIPNNIFSKYLEDLNNSDKKEKSWFCSFNNLDEMSVKLRKYTKNDNIVLEIFPG